MKAIQASKFLFASCRPLLLAGIPIALGLLACPFRPSSVEEAQAEIYAEAKKEPPRVIEVGEVIDHGFPSDGLWHPSPYLAADGAQMALRPTGNARALDEKAMRYKIGRMTHMLRAEQPFKITVPGRILFKVDRDFAGEFQGDVTLQIERMK